MKLSVIIPTRNRAALLRSTLASLATQTLPARDFEVLVVDNASTDDTPAVIAEQIARGLPLRGLAAPEPGLHAGRHAGMREAASDVLVFADDDIEAQPGWLAAIAEAFADPAVAMAGGNCLPLYETEPPRWLVSLWQRPFAGGHAIAPLSVIALPGETRAHDPHLVWGCNYSIRKQVLLAAGGFHPDAMPPDRLLYRGDGETHVSRRVAAERLTCLFHPGATVGHRIAAQRMTAAYFRHRAFLQGISDSYTLHRRMLLRNGRIVPLRRVGHLFKYARRLLQAYLRTGDCTRGIQVGQAKGYLQGFCHHAACVKRMPQLREWVCRERYI